MGQPPSDKELKRLGRVLAGHRTDKDRERWKRKVKGQALAKEAPRKGGARGADALDDDEEREEPE